MAAGRQAILRAVFLVLAPEVLWQAAKIMCAVHAAGQGQRAGWLRRECGAG